AYSIGDALNLQKRSLTVPNFVGELLARGFAQRLERRDTMKLIPRKVRWLAAALAGIAVVLSGLRAQNGDKDKNDKKEKRVQFQMTSQKWEKVIHFLVDNGDFKFQSSKAELPKTTFTFIGPANKMYTITEVFDEINNALLREGLILHRRKDTLILLGVKDDM